MTRQPRSFAPLTGALLAACVPVALIIVLLLRPRDFPGERCVLLVSAPFLAAGMAAPTYIAGRVASHRRRWIAVLWMLAAAAASYLVIASTWAVWGFVAGEICESL